MGFKLLIALVFASVGLASSGENFLHDGIVDSLSYDPSLLSLLQMEQSINLDQGEDDDVSGLDFLQRDYDDLDGDAYGGFESFLQEADEDSDLLEEQDEDDFADDGSLLETQGAVANAKGDQGDDLSFLELAGKAVPVPNSTFGSLVQLHNFESDPLNFLQDNTLLLVNGNKGEAEEEEDEEEAVKDPNLKVYNIKADSSADLPLEPDTFENSTAAEMVAVASGFKFWIIPITLLLIIALIVRLFYLDNFLKFKAELCGKMDRYNKAVLEKVNGVFNKNSGEPASTEEEASEDTPLLNA